MDFGSQNQGAYFQRRLEETYVTDDEVNGVTPWHPWYPHHVFDSYLLCWVPESLVSMVTEGIYVNPEECILWATGLDTVFLRRLKQAGLVV